MATLRGVALPALLALASSAVVGWLASFAASQQPVLLNVRWAPELAADEMARTERSLGLVRDVAVGERAWRYLVGDRSEDSLRAIVLHPLVEDTGGIDRRTLAIESVSAAGWRAFRVALILWLGLGLAFTLTGLPEPSPDGRASAIANRTTLAIVGSISIALAYWSFRAELPYMDMFRSLDYVGRRTWLGMASDTFSGTAEFRPLYFVVLKLLHGLAGPSQILLRTAQMALVLVNLLLFRSLVGSRSVAAATGFTVGVFCFVGLHTSGFMFASALTPYAALIVNALVFASLLWARRDRDRLTDWAVGAMSVVALLLIEYGVVVPMMWALAGLLRLGSARRRTGWLALGVIAAYGLLRILTNSTPIPGPFYTESGFLFQEHFSVEAQGELFGEHVCAFYLYNVSATILTVLFSEPRAGVYRGLEALVHGVSAQPWQIINWATSAVSTLLIGVWLVRWSGLRADRRRLLALGAVVFAGNCLLGYLYTRDRIPTLAGAVYAVFLAVAVADLVRSRARLQPGYRRVLATVLLVALGLGWGMRTVGTIVRARDQAWAVKDEWTDRYEHLEPSIFAGTPPDDRRTDELLEELRRRGVARTLPDPRQDPDWTREWFQRTTF